MKTKYSDEPLGEIRVINDFLPPPSELVFKEDAVKVTLGLSRRERRLLQEAGNEA